MRKVEKLEDEVNVLKAEVGNIKQNMVRMYKLIKEIQVIPDVKKPQIEKEKVEDKKELEDAESKEDDDENGDDDKDIRSTDSKNKKEGQEKFKCEQCNYEAKKKITLTKHINTKHGNVKCGKGQKSEGEVASKVISESKEKRETICQDCTSCENCDYLDNNDCEMCDKMFEADIKKYLPRK